LSEWSPSEGLQFQSERFTLNFSDRDFDIGTDKQCFTWAEENGDY